MTEPREIAGVPPTGLFTDSPDGWLLACPVCGFDYTHSLFAATRVGSDCWEAATYGGAKPTGVTGERRSALVAVFDCENGHCFALVVQQHKGRNFVTVEQWPAPVDVEGNRLESFVAWLKDQRRAAQIRLIELKRERAAARASRGGHAAE